MLAARHEKRMGQGGGDGVCRQWYFIRAHKQIFGVKAKAFCGWVRSCVVIFHSWGWWPGHSVGSSHRGRLGDATCV